MFPTARPKVSRPPCKPHPVGVVQDACSPCRRAKPVTIGEVQRGRLREAAEGFTCGEVCSGFETEEHVVGYAN